MSCTAFSHMCNKHMPWNVVWRADVKHAIPQGEFDAMAVCQATGFPAVSLPNGASSLPLGILPLLERFEKIYLWMDNDEPGQAGVEKFAQKLVRRSRRIW